MEIEKANGKINFNFGILWLLIIIWLGCKVIVSLCEVIDAIKKIW